MNGDVSIDIGSAVPYAVDSVLSLFGKDSISVAAKERLEKRIRISIEQGSQVQCVGMDKPIPLANIYQSTKLRSRHHSHFEESIDFSEILDSGKNAIIFGGPGSGKTILMHWTLMNLINEDKVVPILFTLRSQNAFEDLTTFIKDLNSNRIVKNKKDRIILLIDGYDEISVKIQKQVSELLREFSSLNRGNFYLTSRLYYTIIDLTAPCYYLKPFDQFNARDFIKVFFSAYGINQNPDDIIDELSERGFSDFFNSPLMLALVCILKTGPLPHLPKNTIGLIRRAIDTLTFRWDEGRGIAREGAIPLDGEERVRCLMRIAYRYPTPNGSENLALSETKKHLSFLQRNEVNPSKLLREIAQWYGVFVPTSDGEWSFSHRTIHDFLAARFWVESGSFYYENISNTQWTARTAYAACLVPDATNIIVKSLEKSREMHVLVECLLNNAPFDAKKVAKGILKHYSIKRFRKSIQYDKAGEKFTITLPQDYVSLLSNLLIIELIQIGKSGETDAHSIVYALSLSEMIKRKITIESYIRQDLENFAFHIKRGGENMPPFYLKDVHRLISDET